MRTVCGLQLKKVCEVTLRSQQRHLSSAEFASTAPLLLLQQCIAKHQDAVISAQTFQDLAKQCRVADSASAQRKFVDAGLMAPIDNGAYFHLKVAQLLADANNFNVADVARENHRRACEEHQKLLDELHDAIAKASRWRKCVWGGALLFSGAQMAVISRLTYFDLDWDIMEPVSYFIGTGTSLAFFLYVLRFRREHNYVDFDQTFVPQRVKKFAPPNFNWAQYDASCLKVQKTKEELDAMARWAVAN